MFLAYAVETLDWTRYQGKTLTFSFYAKGGANYSPTSGILGVNLYTGTGTDQDPLAALTGEVQQIGQNAVITTTATRYTYTFTCPSNSTDMRFNFSIAPTGTAGAADFVEITGVQIELGSYATTFSRAGGTIQGELAACQRYYYRAGSADTNAYGGLSNAAFAQTTTVAISAVALPVQMRIAPTAVDFANVAFRQTNGSANGMTGITIDSGQTSATIVSIYGTTSSMTINLPGFLMKNNDSAGYLGFSAEL
jgi:hypothetical protein